MAANNVDLADWLGRVSVVTTCPKEAGVWKRMSTHKGTAK